MAELLLYHSSTSVCAIKVRLTLSEKGLEYDHRLLSLQDSEQKAPDYMKLNPNGVVPTLVHDGKVVIESSIICQYLDEAFPELPLMPNDPHARARMRLWMKKVDDGMHPAVNTLTFATANRKALLAKTPKELQAYYDAKPDPVHREKLRQLVEGGLEAPVVIDAVKLYDKRLDELEEALGDAPFLAGEDWSLADAAVTPYINRLDMIGLDRMWEGARPRLADWFARIKSRKSYGEALNWYFTADDEKRFASEGVDAWAKVETILRAAGTGRFQQAISMGE